MEPANAPKIIDGNRIAEAILNEVREEVATIEGRKPGVVFIRVGEDPASRSYVLKKKKVSQSVGIESEVFVYPENITREELLANVDAFNRNPSVDGILVQSPMPGHLDESEIFNAIDPLKDVDGFHRINSGKLFQEDADGFVPCTPLGVVEMLKRSGIATSGKHVVVIGRSLIVGKPLAMLLSRKHEWGNATVTICHSRSSDLASITRTADILIAAIGRPEFVKASMVKPGATVIDVGINRVTDAESPKGYRLSGDVAFDEVAPLCNHITPVPGGVGPMTVAMLMSNTLKAYRLRSASDI